MSDMCVFASIVVLHVLMGCDQPTPSPYMPTHRFGLERKELNQLIPEIRYPLQRIWSALWAYRAKHGVYCSSLDDLVGGGFLDEIPEPQWGTKRWMYRSFPDDDTFQLVIKESGSSYEGLYITVDSAGRLTWVWDH